MSAKSIDRHKVLHAAFDELLACWLQHGNGIEADPDGRRGTDRPIMDLVRYSAEQAGVHGPPARTCDYDDGSSGSAADAAASEGVKHE